MKRLILFLFLGIASLLPCKLVLKFEGDKQIDLYSDYYALIIGNSEYDNFANLPGVKEDIKDIKETFDKFGIHSTVLENCSSGQMQKALNDFVDVHGCDINRALIFYYAGHGYTEQRADGSDLGYIVPIDAPQYDSNRSEFRNKALSMTKINDIAELTKSKHVLMIFDSCFSGSVFSVKRAAPQNISEKTSQQVRQFITAGTADEMVPDGSIFKNTFVKGLKDGFADLNNDGYITAEELGAYLSEEVAIYTNDAQHPQYGKTKNPNLDRGDFVFAVNVPITPTTQTHKQSPAPPSQPYTEIEYLTGDLRITSDFEAEIIFDGIFLGRVSQSKNINAKAYAVGIHRLDILCGNKKVGLRVEVLMDKTTSVNILKSEFDALVKGKNSFVLNSDPTDTSFTLKGFPDFEGRTPFVFIDPEPTDYEATFKRARYNDTSVFFSTTTDKAERVVKLDLGFGGLRVSSNPADCKVLIDGKLVGNTPLYLTGEQNGLEPGSYTLELIPDNQDFAPLQKEINIRANDTVNEHLELKNILVTLNIISDHYPVQVFVNNVLLGELGKEGYFKVRPGELNVVILPVKMRSTPLKSWNLVVNMQANEYRTLRAKVIPSKSSLSFKPEQDDVNIVLTNPSGDSSKPKGSSQLLYPGTYTVTASKWGYYSEQKILELTEGVPKTARFNLERIPDRLFNKQATWELQRVASISTLAATLATSAYLYVNKEKAWDSYVQEPNQQAANELLDSYNKSYDKYKLSLYVNIAPALWYTFSLIKSVQTSNRIKAEMNSRLLK